MGSARRKNRLNPRDCQRNFGSYRPADAFPFPEAQGKTLADLYLTTDSDISCITLAFNDNTDLVIDIEPCLAFSAGYSDWKTGDQRVIKRWPRIRST